MLSEEMTQKEEIDVLRQENKYLKDKYDRLVTSVTGYVYTVEVDDKGDVCTTHGPGCETITGYSSQEYKSNPLLWASMIHDEDRDIVLSYIHDINKGQHIPPFEHRIIHKDGSIRYIRNTLIAEDDKKAHRYGIITDITERRQAEERLRENYNFISSVVDGINANVYAKDNDGRYILANLTLCKFLGRRRDEILGKTVRDMFSHEMAQIMEEMDSKILQHEQSHLFVNKIHHDNKSYIFLTNKTVYKDMDGNSAGVIGISQDITLLMEKEEKEKKLLNELKLLLNNLPLGIVYLDKDFTVLKVNEQVCKMSSMSKDELIGKKCYDLFGEYANDPVRYGKEKICSYCRINECIDEGKILIHEAKYKDRYVRVTSIPEYNEDGEATRVLEIIEDITSSLTKQLLETIAQGITEEIMLISNDYKILWVNNVLLNNRGYKMDDIIGMPCYKVTHHYKSECKVPNDPCPLIENRDNNMRKSVIHKHFNHDGKIHYVEVTLYPITDSNGVTDKYVHVAKDMTERIMAEERTKTSLREKELLLGEVHHRIKNNLAIVASLLKTQRYKIKDKYYNNIFKETENRIMAIALIHELLYDSDDITRIDFRGYIDRLVQNLYQIYRTQLEKIQLKVAVSDLELGIDIAVPCGLLINEMLTNAVKYAFPDELRGEVSIELSDTPQGYIELTVRDNGVGIPEAIDIRNNKTMGFEIIIGIAEIQLGGSVEFSRKEGTEIKVRFKPVKRRMRDVSKEGFSS